HVPGAAVLCRNIAGVHAIQGVPPMDMPPFYALFIRALPHEEVYARLGEIQRRLLETLPFQGCKADEIQDLRYPSAPPMPCKNRPELITDMVVQLYSAGRIEDFRKMAPETLRDIALGVCSPGVVVGLLPDHAEHPCSVGAGTVAERRHPKEGHPT